MIKCFDYKYDFVSDIIETSGSIVHKNVLPQKLPGINFIIEIVKDEIPINKTIGVLVESFEKCKINEEISIVIPMEHIAYYSKNELPVLFIVVSEIEGLAYWSYSELPQLNQIVFQKNKLFDLSTFNLDVIPTILFSKPLLSNIKERLQKTSFEELLKFIQSNFHFLDLAMPYILKNKNFEDFLKDTNTSYKVYNIESVNAVQNVQPKHNGGQFNFSGRFTWWIVDGDIFHISLISLIQLSDLYKKLKVN